MNEISSLTFGEKDVGLGRGVPPRCLQGSGRVMGWGSVRGEVRPEESTKGSLVKRVEGGSHWSHSLFSHFPSSEWGWGTMLSVWVWGAGLKGKRELREAEPPAAPPFPWLWEEGSGSVSTGSPPSLCFTGLILLSQTPCLTSKTHS